MIILQILNDKRLSILPPLESYGYRSDVGEAWSDRRKLVGCPWHLLDPLPYWKRQCALCMHALPCLTPGLPTTVPHIAQPLSQVTMHIMNCNMPIVCTATATHTRHTPTYAKDLCEGTGHAGQLV
jgi:hypothetical protein